MLKSELRDPASPLTGIVPLGDSTARQICYHVRMFAQSYSIYIPTNRSFISKVLFDIPPKLSSEIVRTVILPYSQDADNSGQ